MSQQSLKLSQMKIKVQLFRLIGSLSELLFGSPISHHSLNPTFYHNRVSDASKMPDFYLSLFSPNSPSFDGSRQCFTTIGPRSSFCWTVNNLSFYLISYLLAIIAYKFINYRSYRSVRKKTN